MSDTKYVCPGCGHELIIGLGVPSGMWALSCINDACTCNHAEAALERNRRLEAAANEAFPVLQSDGRYDIIAILAKGFE